MHLVARAISLALLGAALLAAPASATRKPPPPTYEVAVDENVYVQSLRAGEPYTLAYLLLGKG